MIRGIDSIRARLQNIPPASINDWPPTTSQQARWQRIPLSELPLGAIWVVAVYVKMEPDEPFVYGETTIDGTRRKPCIRPRPATLWSTVNKNSRGQWFAAIRLWESQFNLDPRADYGVWRNLAFSPRTGFETLTQQFVITTPGCDKKGMPYLAESTYHTVDTVHNPAPPAVA